MALFMSSNSSVKTLHLKKISSIGLILVLSVTMFTACTGASSGAAGSSNTDSSNTSASSDAADVTDVTTIEHAMGTTEIPVHAQRVVILTQEGTEALIALGVKPIGAANSNTSIGDCGIRTLPED
ncbi:MAG: hypothetical protein WCD89_19370 [Anaerocolumna sp.]